jgi:MFS family permease
MTRTERTYYVVFGGYSLAMFFIAPIYPLFLMSRGLDVFQANAVLATYLITAFVFDVPTGVIADRFGRKASFIGACAIRMFAYGLYAFTRNFTDCMVAEFFDAVGTTFANGALDAWMVDGVAADGDRRPTDRIFARGQVIARASMVGGGIACGYLAEVGWNLPWFVSAAMFAVTGLAAIFLMHETRPPARATALPSPVRTAVLGIRTVAAAPALLLICLIALAGAFAGFPLHITWQARVQDLAGAGLWRMGWILAFLNVAGVAGSALLPRLLRRFERHVVLVGATLWRVATLALAASVATLSPTVAGLVLGEVSPGLTEPMLVAWANEHVPADYRATVLSVRSTFITLGGALGLLSLGLVARRFGIPSAWGACAVVFALVAPGYLLLGRQPAAAPADVGPLTPAELLATPGRAGPHGIE